MKKQKAKILFWALFLLLVISSLALYFFWGESLLSQALFHFEDVMANGTKARETILSFGPLAPLMFMTLQILQVVFAPVPGEATGILGGYIFGAWPSFIYSSIALAAGSALAFIIGHLFADAFRSRFSKTKVYRKFNHLVFKGDFVIPFVLFLFPGFPKDSLAYLLGLSTMPFKVFIFIASIARMPGTLFLSFEGAQVYAGNYLELLLLLLFSAIIALPCILYRRQILEKLTHYSSAQQIEHETEPEE
ncbi:MAG: VTT domain-containing protein [Desulfobacterales bacterium]|nr:VTT domain-containing protein [Desulfobacterales bacterium]